MMTLYILVTIILLFVEVKVQKQYITPFTTFSLVYLVLVIYNNIISIQYGFIKISNYTAYILLLFNILVFFISMYSMIFRKTLAKSEKKKTDIDSDYINITILNNKKKILILFLIGLIAKYISLYQSIQVFGIENIKGNSFGIFAHIGSLAVILSPYVLSMILKLKEKKYIIFWILILINLLIFGGKYGVIFFMLHNLIFISLIMEDSFFRIFKKAILAFFFSISIFILIYGVIPLVLSQVYSFKNLMDRMSFILKHFSFYLTSPIVAMNTLFMNPSSIRNGIEIIFTVPINILKALSGVGNYVIPVLNIKVPVSFEYQTNVGGLVGELVYTGGWGIAFLWMTLVYLFIYIFFIDTVKNKQNISLTALLLSTSVMSFFGNFYTVFGIVIQLIFLFVLERLLRNFGKRKQIEKIRNNNLKLER